MTTQEAVNHLCKALRADPAYWHSWKANIAVCFQDEFRRSHRMNGVYDISNNAAEQFLEKLTYEPKEGGAA